MNIYDIEIYKTHKAEPAEGNLNLRGVQSAHPFVQLFPESADLTIRTWKHS